MEPSNYHDEPASVVREDLIIMFIGLTHEYMVKISIKNGRLNCYADVDDDGVIVWGDTSPISGRVKMGHSFQVLDRL